MIASIPAAALLVVLAQSPPGGGAVAQYQITLEFHGVWGLVPDQSGTCPGVPGNDSDQTRIEFETDPARIMAVAVSVNGACDTLDNADLAAEYRSHNALYFETNDGPVRG